MSAPVSNLYSVEQVAELLDVHVKTVRRYVRDGRLKAKRIGKEYRIARGDLEAFAGPVQAPAKDVVRTRHVIVSSIFDVDAISSGDSERITTFIMASLHTRRGEGYILDSRN